MSTKQSLITPLLKENPVTLHVLGICSALAITNSLTSSLIMSVAMIIVLIISNTTISLIRKHLPASVRIIVQITIIASAVAVIDQLLTAFLPDAARTLSVYISLIVTNCIVLGRAEACAMKNTVGISILDAIGNGLGYGLVLIIVSTIRELFGNGSLMGFRILELIQDGGWYQPNSLLLLPPSAFFIIGILVWTIRSWKPEQCEKQEFEPIPIADPENDP